MPGHSALDSVVQYTIAKYLFFYFNVSPAQFSGLSMPYISDDRKRAHFWSYSWKNSMQVFSCNFLEYNIFTNWFFSSLCSNGWWIHFRFTTYYVYICSIISDSKYIVVKLSQSKYYNFFSALWVYMYSKIRFNHRSDKFSLDSTQYFC